MKATAIFILVKLVLVYCTETANDGVVTIENENYEDNNIISSDTSTRTGRILWPYPLNHTKNDDDGHLNDNKNKEALSLPKDQEVNSKNESKEKEDLSQDKHTVEKKNQDPVNVSVNKGQDRKSRFLPAYLQSPLADIILTSMSGNTVTYNPSDPFDFLRDSYPLPKGYSQPLEEYDYIIVGAGSAGSVLASRLTEDKPRAMVLVLEAGKPEMLPTDIPALAGNWPLSDYAFQYSAEQQNGTCLGSINQRCFWPRGKAVGGTSVINYMVYSRGRREDWDRVAADGNYGWNYDEVLKYYLKSERANLKRVHDQKYHSCKGDLSVQNVPFRTGLVEAFLEAGRLTGSPTVDYNSPDQFGFGYLQGTLDKGHRASAAKAFLRPHKRRRNLHILPESRVTRVLIEPQTKRAYGVEYIRNGKLHKVRARREVILSAGPIASPQLLMLSGVGPQDHLNSLGIPVIKDLPVGRTLYDHITFPGVTFRLETNNASLFENKIATLPNFIEWMQFGEGLLTTPGTIEAIGFIKTPVSQDPLLVPDIELISLASSLNIDSGGNFKRSWGISQETYDSAFKSLNGHDTWTAVPMLLHPKSKGYLELKDRNPFSHPKIVANYLSHPQDMATMKAAIKHIISLGETEPFRRKYGAKLHLGQYHTCRTATPGTDEYWDCAVRTLMISLHHQIATCRMGPPSDPEAIVDPELRVYGIVGLRVVDSSVIPRTVSAHTNAPAIMIGEKAADMIKSTWVNVV